MTSDEIKSLANEATAFLAAIPALTPYAAPISLGLAVAAAVAPSVYDEIKTLFAKATGGGVFRKGVWHGSRTRDPWDIYPTMTSEVQQASDHAAIYADLDL